MKTRGLTVPCFMFLSFYLTSKNFDNNDSFFLIKRIKRLEYPIIIWTIIYYIAMSLLSFTLLDWKSIIYSIIFGSSGSLNPVLWFMSTQILITVFFYIIYLMCPDKNKRIFILALIIIISFFSISRD